MAQNFCFLLFDGFSNHCLANVVESLRAANTLSGQSLYKWSFVSEFGKKVTSSSGLSVAPSQKLNDSEGDMLLTMSSYHFKQHSNSALNAKLCRAKERFGSIAGLDTGSWLLAAAGMLNGYQATIHLDEFEEFAETFPEVIARRTQMTIDRDRITCSDAAAAFDLAHELITLIHGPTLAFEVGQLFVTRLPEASNLHKRIPFDRLVRRAVIIMKDRIETPISIKRLASELGCSQRKLEKHFDNELQVTPQQFYKRLRMSQAHKLLRESNLSIAEISVRCGYKDVSAMGRAFRSEFEKSPREVRGT